MPIRLAGILAMRCKLHICTAFDVNMHQHMYAGQFLNTSVLSMPAAAQHHLQLPEPTE